MFDLPGWVVPITLFLATELGAAIWFAARLKSAVDHLSDEVQALKDSKFLARLTALEVRVDERQRRLDGPLGI